MSEDVRLYQGDCLAELPRLDELIVDTVITDPPYELGFMGKCWDSSGVAFQPETWEAVSRVAKPGAFLLAFGGTRTFHRLTCAIEDAGWEIRDCIMWIYGSGFPKSLDISKAIDKAAGAEREILGECSYTMPKADNAMPERSYGISGGKLANGTTAERIRAQLTAPATDAAREWSGWGTALKPAFEPIIVAMKPLDGTFVQNAQRHGVAGLNIDGGRINGEPWKAHDATGLARDKFFTKGPCAIVHKEPHNLGRWPANVILDEWHEPVLRLKNTMNSGTVEAIAEFFYDYKVRGVRTRICDLPESDRKEQGAVLRARLLRQSAKQETPRASALHVRKETPTGIAGEDEARKAGAWEAGSRSESSEVQGRLEIAGLPLSQHQRLAAGSAGNGAGNVPEGSRWNPRASSRNGDEIGEAIDPQRVRTSSQRGEGRQSTGQLGGDGQFNPQATPQGNPSRASSIEVREREIEILARDIPDGWLKHFEPTGYAVRMGAGKMLDEQSGTTTSGAMKHEVGGYGGESATTFLRGNSGPSNQHGDSGGASRFFYCAKSSRSERGDGNNHPTVKPLKLMEYLCRLTATPTGGTVLDPFMGSGTTGIAALRTGRSFIGIEMDPGYFKIAEQRIAAAQRDRAERLIPA